MSPINLSCILYLHSACFFLIYWAYNFFFLPIKARVLAQVKEKSQDKTRQDNHLNRRDLETSKRGGQKGKLRTSGSNLHVSCPQISCTILNNNNNTHKCPMQVTFLQYCCCHVATVCKYDCYLQSRAHSTFTSYSMRSLLLFTQMKCCNFLCAL